MRTIQFVGKRKLTRVLFELFQSDADSREGGGVRLGGVGVDRWMHDLSADI